MIDTLNEQGLSPDSQQIEHSLERLQLGFILKHDEQGLYGYRVPLFCEMILKDAPEVKLKAELNSWDG